MSETERERPPSAATGAAAPAPPSAMSALELLTSLVGGTDGPADAPLPPAAAGARAEQLTDGVVELRKRGELAGRRAGADAGDCLEAMARRAAERACRPRA